MFNCSFDSFSSVFVPGDLDVLDRGPFPDISIPSPFDVDLVVFLNQPQQTGVSSRTEVIANSAD